MSSSTTACKQQTKPKISVLKNKSLQPQTQEVVMNVLDYFQRESENGGSFLPLTSLNERTAAACGLTLHTVSTTKKRMKLAEETNTMPHTPQKTRRRLKKKSTDIDIVIKDAIRRKVHEMHSQSIPLSLASIQKALSEAEIFNFKRESLRRLLKSIGIFYRKSDIRKGLYELEQISEEKNDPLNSRPGATDEKKKMAKK